MVRDDPEGYAKVIKLLVKQLGADHVPIGTDLSGVGDSISVNNYADVRRVVKPMQSSGLDGTTVARVSYQNYARVLRASRQCAHSSCLASSTKFSSAPLQECERCDPKGLYQCARQGHLLQFTGISAPYEAPLQADITVDTSDRSLVDSVQAVSAHILALQKPRVKDGLNNPISRVTVALPTKERIYAEARYVRAVERQLGGLRMWRRAFAR